MDDHKNNNVGDSEILTYSEQTVLDAVNKRKVHIDDLSKIAKMCRLSEMQAGVALQLLTHKNLISRQ
jgi:hypothetical protein